jgi:hypothetical protein
LLRLLLRWRRRRRRSWTRVRVLWHCTLRDVVHRLQAPSHLSKCRCHHDDGLPHCTDLISYGPTVLLGGGGGGGIATAISGGGGGASAFKRITSPVSGGAGGGRRHVVKCISCFSRWGFTLDEFKNITITRDVEELGCCFREQALTWIHVHINAVALLLSRRWLCGTSKAWEKPF